MDSWFVLFYDCANSSGSRGRSLSSLRRWPIMLRENPRFRDGGALWPFALTVSCWGVIRAVLRLGEAWAAVLRIVIHD